MRCHHESERYENIMDLTLEIFGWVQSLEDALTQFTNPEDLDGENKYRCGRLLVLYMSDSCSNLERLCKITLHMELKWVKLNIFRCAAYVRARKQLSIHEAPNILTIVLKRFQVLLSVRRG